MTQRDAMKLVTAGACALLVGCQAGSDPHSDFLGGLLDPLMSPTPSQAARNAFNVDDPDKRSRSVALLAASSFGGEAPYVRMYRLLLDDPDAAVRASAIKALGMHGSVEDAALIVPLLEDDAAFVRWEAAKALQRVHDPVAVQPLIAVVRNDSDADVRMAAADALGQYAAGGVFDTLVGALTDPNYGVARAAGNSLETLTGHSPGLSNGVDPATWLAWAEGRRGELFVHQEKYAYRTYREPPGWLDKMQFWTDPAPARSGNTPIGLKTPDTTRSSG